MIELDASSVARTAREWDERSIELDSAQRLVTTAATEGFTPVVADAASRFLGVWGRHLSRLAGMAERHGDDLRGVIRTYLEADGAVALDFHIGLLLMERR